MKNPEHKEGKVITTPLQETVLHSMLSAETESSFFEALSEAAKELGFEYCAYGMQAPLPISNPKLFMVNNYPKDWQNQYIQQNYLHVDPTVIHGKHSVMPLLWTEDVFANCRPFWEDACAHGLKVGWAQSCYNANGVGGLLTLARSEDNLSSKELNELSLIMSWLSLVAHEGMSRIILPKLMPEATVTLTAREAEVLRWTAMGKSSYETGMIMNISERTVNFHINNLMIKLGTHNKIAAVAKALLLGLL